MSSRPSRSARPDFSKLAETEARVDAAIKKTTRAPTAAELEQKAKDKAKAEARRAERAAAAAAAALEAAASQQPEEPESEASESEEGEEHTIESLLVCRKFLGRSKFVLVKWVGHPHSTN
eukprot:79677-Prymnesium_polylepis.1